MVLPFFLHGFVIEGSSRTHCFIRFGVLRHLEEKGGCGLEVTNLLGVDEFKWSSHGAAPVSPTALGRLDIKISQENF